MSHESTVRVRRGGTYLTIAATSVERYIAKGFDVVGTDGRVINEGVPNDVNALKKAFEEHVAKIKSLEAKISELEAKKSEAVESVKPTEEPKAVEVIEKPAKQTAKQSTKQTAKKSTK